MSPLPPGLPRQISAGCASSYQGKVSASNPNCVAERIVVLEPQGNGVLSRVESKENGNWKADLDELNANLKIPAKVFVEMKPATQATAGPIYKCLGATSKTVESPAADQSGAT